MCGTEAYPLAMGVVCSPWFAVMNWGFVLYGAMMAAGALCLRRVWPGRVSARVASVAWVVFGLSWSGSGLVPADVAFLTHTLIALPGILAPTVALMALALALRRRRRGLAMWSLALAGVTVAALALVTASVVWGIPPGGLTQRLHYAVSYLGLIGLGVGLLVSRRWTEV
jgi:hypothetical protein